MIDMKQGWETKPGGDVYEGYFFASAFSRN
jgi:hypothetical protein